MCPRVDAVEFVTNYFFRTQTCVRTLTLGLKKIASVDVDWWGECISICSVTAEPYVANQIQFFFGHEIIPTYVLACVLINVYLQFIIIFLRVVISI